MLCRSLDIFGRYFLMATLNYELWPSRFIKNAFNSFPYHLYHLAFLHSTILWICWIRTHQHMRNSYVPHWMLNQIIGYFSSWSEWGAQTTWTCGTRYKPRGIFQMVNMPILFCMGYITWKMDGNPGINNDPSELPPRRLPWFLAMMFWSIVLPACRSERLLGSGISLN